MLFVASVAELRAYIRDVIHGQAKINFELKIKDW